MGDQHRREIPNTSSERAVKEEMDVCLLLSTSLAPEVSNDPSSWEVSSNRDSTTLNFPKEMLLFCWKSYFSCRFQNQPKQNHLGQGPFCFAGNHLAKISRKPTTYLFYHLFILNLVYIYFSMFCRENFIENNHLYLHIEKLLLNAGHFGQLLPSGNHPKRAI